MTIRIAFLGTPDVAVAPLRALAADPRVEIVVVLTNPDRPRGRSKTPQPPPVKIAALELGIEVWQPEKPREVLAQLTALRLDAAAVVAYGSLLPDDVLASVRTGFVNLHYSLLPRWRGAAPVQHAILARDAVSGLSTFVLDRGMDTGPLLRQVEVPLDPHVSSSELLTLLTERGTPVLVESVIGLAAGTLSPTPQVEDGATLAPKILTEDALIDWSAPADQVSALIRHADPRPGAHTTWRDARCKVWHARVADAEVARSGLPGEVVARTDDGPVVACGDGCVVLHVVQPSGKPKQLGRDFVNGQQPTSGERFGA
jgi:methionyl-tRNA formyltransferase